MCPLISATSCLSLPSGSLSGPPTVLPCQFSIYLLSVFKFRLSFQQLRLRCNTGEYPRVRVPVIFSKAITRTQRVFRHGYPSPAGDTTGYPRARVPAGESGYHYQYPWYPWSPLVQVWSRLLIMTRLATLSHAYAPMLYDYDYIYIYLFT